MKVISNLLTAILILLIIFTCTKVKDEQASTDLASANIGAAEGDTMWVLLNHIKADKCEQFEKLVHEIFWPITKNSELAIDQQVAKYTRTLHPVKMNKDSTYTYVFIMDPLIQGADYGISSLLKKKYDEEKTKEYVKMFNECYAGPQTGYTLIQSQH